MSSARISPRRGLAGSDRGGDELAGESIVNMERHQAVFVFMGVEEQQLLRTMTMNRCRVHGDDNGLGMGGKRLKENLARRVTNANQFFAVQNRFSRRLMVGWEASAASLPGTLPTAVKKAGSNRRYFFKNRKYKQVKAEI